MLLTEDQSDFRASVRNFFDAASSTERTLEFIETDAELDTRLWRRITTELGLTSLGVPEALGGAGASIAEACVALEEGGGALAPVPLLAASWAAAALSASAGDLADHHQRRIADGATYLFAQPVHIAEWESPSLSAEGNLVSGDAVQLAAGGDAMVALVRTDGGVAVAVVQLQGHAEHLVAARLRPFDPTRPQVSISLRDCPADIVRLPAGGVSVLRDRCFVMAGAESIGVMRHTLEGIIAYSKERFAFGRPIGSYQALKHQLVDHWVAYECADAALMEAVTTRESETFAAAAALIRHSVLTTAARVATDVVRLYGGIGYTWEHEAHLYCKRAIGNSALFGPAHESRAGLARHLQL